MTALITDRRMLEHDAGFGHPERPDRLAAILDRLERDPPPNARWVDPPPAPDASIERCHDPDYVARILALEGRTARLDADTAVSPGSIAAARLAAGASVRAAEIAMGADGGPGEPAFALVRPPGHHAESAVAMGFCLFDNIAIAAEHALAELGCRRVMIVDWDVHHGNGTQHIFEERADVLVLNLFQEWIYPGTGRLNERGRGPGVGTTVNMPLPGGSGDSTWLAAVEATVPRAMERFSPDLVLVSAGFDGHVDDPLAGMAVTTAGYAQMCAQVTSAARRFADGRVALVLEGGYDLDALSSSVRACAGVLSGEAAPDVEIGPGAVRDRILSLERLHGWVD